MSVTVDHQSLPAGELGLQTVGQVLSHLQKDNRIVVQVLLDGLEPDLSAMAAVRQTPLDGHELFIQTADPRQLAGEVFDDLEKHLGEAEKLKDEAAALLQQGQPSPAMQRLAGCFTTWQHAQESIAKTAQLLRIDLSAVQCGGKPLAEMLCGFGEQLKSIRSTLEQRDFVQLSDVLVYEMTRTTQEWRDAIGALRATMAI